MLSSTQKVLLFGDQSDAFVEGIDYICKQAEHQPWLRSFLADASTTLHDQTRFWERVPRESLGSFQTIQELSDKFRHQGDGTGLAHGLLVFIMRQALLLQCMKRDPALISGSQTISVCGGFLNAAALAIAKDFETLYEASLELLRVLCRVERLVYNRAKAIDLSEGSWAYALTGISASTLQSALDKFQDSLATPEIKKVRIGLVGEGWSTIIGPPCTLNRVLQRCTAVKALPKQDLNIRGPFHILSLSNAELDDLVGSSSLLDLPAGNASWRSVVKTACEHILTRPFNIVETVEDLNSRLGSVKVVDLNVIGTSSHAVSIASQLKATGKVVTLRHELSNVRLPPNSGADNSAKIAIVGMAGQAPGAEHLSDFWDINLEGLDLHKRIPEDRFDIQEFFSSTHDGVCSTAAQYGCFIDRPGAFDARFFNISHREALLMEPCHRLWLMSVYEALEMAGYSQNPTRLTDPNRIGVFFGQSVSDWKATTHHRGCNSYDLQGVQRAFGAGRVNYHFKWEGPSYNVDSACASSASAITLACQNLLSHEVDMAVAGGSNAISSPHAYSELSRAGVLSVTGNCKPFRDDADGYCRGEFSGAVVLKRLDDAVAANDNILAVIAASARNHSGNATSITASDAGAQQRLFRQVLAKAHIAPDDVSYVEMHGTGTQIGDVAEMRAVANTFKRSGGDKDTLKVGSLKANLGHSEGAAGIASLLKCILSLQNELLPPVVNMPHRLNPKFPDLQQSHVEIPVHGVEFKASKDKVRRMVMNNFDASGGNTCLVVEDFAKAAAKTEDPRSCHVVTVSSKSATSQIESKKKLLKFLNTSGDGYRIEDLAYTTTARKMHYPYRTAIAASSIRQFIDKLDADIKRDATLTRITAPPVVFMFTGQGSHYAGMGAALYKTSRVFRNTIDLCVTLCNQHGLPGFIDIITDSSQGTSTQTTTQIQLAVVCLEIALAGFWQANGVEPALVMGHSLGEYPALYVAGVLSLADVLLLVGRRAQLVLEGCEQYTFSMLSIVSSPNKVMDYLIRHSSCEIACLNSLKATVVSGPAEAVANLQRELETDGIRSHRLSLPYGFHSDHVDCVLNDYATLARGVTYCPPKVPIASTLSAAIIEKPGTINETYLVRQTRRRVDYVGALNAAVKKLQSPVFLEIGPRRVLGDFVQATLKSTTPNKVITTLDGANDEWSSVSKALASLYNAGVDIDWTAFHQPYTAHVKLISLPKYSWDLTDYWLKWTEPRERCVTAAVSDTSDIVAAKPISSILHFVETQMLSPDLRFNFRSDIANPDLKALIQGHRLRAVPVCPGGVFCDIGAEAANYALGARGQERAEFAVLNASFVRPLTLLKSESTADIITTVTMPEEDVLLATFTVRDASSTYNVGQCRLKIVDISALQSQWNKTSYFIKERMKTVTKGASLGEGHRFKSNVFYSLFSRCLEYDKAYMSIKDAYVSADFNEAVAKVTLNEEAGATSSAGVYWSESLVHLAGFLANANPARPQDSTFVANGFEESKRTAKFRAGSEYLSYVRASKVEDDAITYDVFVFDSDDKMVMQCSNLQFRKVDNASLDRILGKANAVASKAPKSTTARTKHHHTPGNPVVMDILLASIAKETGTDASELSDDVVLAELGVDSIMAMQIVGAVKRTSGLDVPSDVVFQCPTIGDVRKELGFTQLPSREAEEPQVKADVQRSAPSTLDKEQSVSTSVLDSILHHINVETGTELNDLKDDLLLSELGCDSIMALHIASRVGKETGYDLQGSFVFEYPSIMDIRRAFGKTNKSTPTPTPTSTALGPSHRLGDGNGTSSDIFDPEDVSVSRGPHAIPIRKRAVAPYSNLEAGNLLTQGSAIVKTEDKNVDQELIDFADVPEAKIILMQGKSSSKETPLFLMSDGFGTAACYIHLPRFKSGLPVYAIESSFLRCPGKLTRKAGIPAIAKFAVDAILKARPKGPYLLGGFSGGATISYEICRQLVAKGCKLQGLLLIDMCCPRKMDESTDSMAKGGLPLVQRLLPPPQRSMSTSQNRTNFGALHLKQVVSAVCNYDPPPLAPQDRPEHVCIIWARKGLSERARMDSQASAILSDMNLQTDAPEGFMTDVELGPAAWSIPTKTGADLGYNGWDKFLGGGIKVLVADADHLSMPVPPDVTKLHNCMEEALEYFK